MADLENLRYPVGRFERLKAPLDRATRKAHIDTIEATPARFRSLVNGKPDAQLDTPYRPGGWTVRQVVHHICDSHVNAYIRMKFAMTEDAPAIKAYDEGRWAELPEAKSGPVGMSLALLDGLHQRWIAFLRNLSDADFSRVYVHPELGRVTLDEALSLYAWHCRHHEVHVKLGLGAAREK
ncbi:MAG: putative metal-dependent hydrolase [Acidobacteriia bacterium]|nr:putative metal-dependent hydrolase [Terriglobia bacterium]